MHKIKKSIFLSHGPACRSQLKKLQKFFSSNQFFYFCLKTEIQNFLYSLDQPSTLNKKNQKIV